jgi:hypothetical protein
VTGAVGTYAHYGTGGLKVIEMPTEASALVTSNDELLCPSYWLVSGLDWKGDGPTAEAALAIAPGMIPRQDVSHDAHQILGCADLYARKHSLQVVFFSDLTSLFADAGTSWVELGVDWESGLRELHDGSFPAVFLTSTERVYLQICNPTSRRPRARHCGAGDAAETERELVRRAITRQLANEWPVYMQRITDAGRFSRAR